MLSRILFWIGIFAIVIAALLWILEKIGISLGELPGDFSWQSGNISFYFPLVSSIIVSIILTIVLNLWFFWKP